MRAAVMGEATTWKPAPGLAGSKISADDSAPLCAGAACDQHAAVSQNCRAVIDTRGVQRRARAGGLRFRIENFRGGDEVAVGVASAGDQDAAVGQRGGSVTCSRHGEVIKRLDLFRARGAHPRGDRQHDDRAEEREKVSEDVVSFGRSLHVGGAFFVGGIVWGELLGVSGGITGGKASGGSLGVKGGSLGSG